MISANDIEITNLYILPEMYENSMMYSHFMFSHLLLTYRVLYNFHGLLAPKNDNAMQDLKISAYQ